MNNVQGGERAEARRSIDGINLYSRITVRGPAFNDCWVHTDCKHDGLTIVNNDEINCTECGAQWKKIQ